MLLILSVNNCKYGGVHKLMVYSLECKIPLQWMIQGYPILGNPIQVNELVGLDSELASELHDGT